MNNNEMVSVPRELVQRMIDCAEAYVDIDDADLIELRALLAVPEPHQAEANLAALLILLAQSGVKVSGGIGDEPWSVEPAAQPVPPAGGEPEVLAIVTLGGYFSPDELGDIDLEPEMKALERIQQEIVSSDEDEHIELVDRAHVTRLLAENKRLDLMVAQGDYNRDATVIALRAELAELKARPQGEPVARDSDKWSKDWKEQGFNYCIETAIKALKYLADHPRPIGGESRYNAEHLIMTAQELALTRQELLIGRQPPAPVAVVLPAHRDSDLRSPVYEQARGWNACIDEVARLNPGAKP